MSALKPVCAQWRESLSMSCMRSVPMNRPVPANAGIIVEYYSVGGRERDYDFAEPREKDLDVAQHGAAGAVPREMRLGPDVPVRAVALLLVLQVERGHGRVVAHLLGHVAHAAGARVHDAGKGLADDGVVGLLATLHGERRMERAEKNVHEFCSASWRGTILRCT